MDNKGYVVSIRGGVMKITFRDDNDNNLQQIVLYKDRDNLYKNPVSILKDLRWYRTSKGAIRYYDEDLDKNNQIKKLPISNN